LNTKKHGTTSVVEALNASSFKLDKDRHALVADMKINNDKVLFVLPETFMNNSGDAVSAVSKYYKISSENILVVQDEMDFAPGHFAFAKGGGAGGHNGIKSVYERVGEDVDRLRIGIGRPGDKRLKSDKYVLQRFSPGDRIRIGLVKGKMIDAIGDWIDHGLEKAMNAWHVKR
jgi:PTH1 family peptidyl-tRNA hydrolase